MSHITRITLRVRDLDALAEAAECCSLDLRRNQTSHIWYGRFMGDSPVPAGMRSEDYGRCEHALRLKDHRQGDYEIGLVKAQDGDGYELAVDTWGQGRLLNAVGGPGMDKLKREYAAAVAMRKARKALAHKGYTVKREDIGNRIRVRLVHR